MHEPGLGTLVTFNPASVHVDTPLAELAQRLLDCGFHHWPVLDSDRRVVGIISDADIARHFSACAAARAASSNTSAAPQRELRAFDMMSARVTMIEMSTPWQTALATLVEQQVHSLPVVDDGGLRVRVVAGSVLGVRSPVALAWETMLADVSMDAGAVLPVSAVHDERAFYLIDGSVEIDGQRFEQSALYVLQPGVAVHLRAVTPVTLALLGGEPMDGPRHIWWNFVSSSEERIEQARADWMAGRFRPIPGETERVDAPSRDRLRPVG